MPEPMYSIGGGLRPTALPVRDRGGTVEGVTGGTSMHASLLVGLLFVLDAPTLSAEAEVDIEGEWVVETQMVKGKVTNFRRGPLMRFCDGEFRTDGGGRAAYTLQPAQRPRAITLRTRQGVLLAGIFKMD